MIILLQASWHFSMNAGEDCESHVMGVFKTEKEYKAYLKRHKIHVGMFDHELDLGRKLERHIDDKTWYYRQDLCDA